MIVRWVVVACALTAMPALATQLQGEQRTQMLKQGAGTCLDNNVKKPENRKFTLAAIDAFCTCVGTAAVDTFSIEELQQAGETLTPDFVKRRTAFTQKCGDDTLGKVK